MTAGSRIEEQAADGGQYEAANHAVFIADFADQITHRNRHNRISGKETELNQHRLNIKSGQKYLSNTESKISFMQVMKPIMKKSVVRTTSAGV